MVCSNTVIPVTRHQDPDSLDNVQEMDFSPRFIQFSVNDLFLPMERAEAPPGGTK